MIGKYTYGFENITVHWGQLAELEIGNFCSIGLNLKVYLGGNHEFRWLTTFPFGLKNINTFSFGTHPFAKTNGPVVIGSDVWFGDNVTIMSGVSIGHGAIIGNNSHVVRNVPAYAVVGGNPAEVYFYRFGQDVIRKFLELKWWNFEDSEINEIVPLLCSSNHEALFKKYGK